VGNSMEPEHRRDPRYNVAVDASVRSEAIKRSPVRVTNVSAQGCRFSSVRRLESGSLVTMTFGEVYTLDATVRWRFGGSHGLRFEQPLHSIVLDHIRLFMSEEPAFVAEREPLIA
jgi:hypothetical protein